METAVTEGHGNAAQACRALNLGRSTFYRSTGRSSDTERLETAIVAESHEHPRYGYRRVTAILRRNGEQVNPKRVQRVRRAQGLQVTKKQHRTRRVGKSTAQRRRATRPNEVWSWDFVHDGSERGSGFRMLTLIDEYTRRCLAIFPAWSLRARDVIEIVMRTIEHEGAPEHLRSDNGPEFIARAVQDQLDEWNVKTIYITPGSPWENGHIESFHDKLRDECLNRELFGSLAVARVIVEQWRKEYNQERPHSSLNYRSPDEFAAICNRRLQSGYALLPSAIAKVKTNNQTNRNPAEQYV